MIVKIVAVESLKARNMSDSNAVTIVADVAAGTDLYSLVQICVRYATGGHATS